MWRKVISIIISAAIFVALCSPVVGHNGVIRIPNTFDPGGDEHPWGGDHYIIDNPMGSILTTSGTPSPGFDYLIGVTVSRCWDIVSEAVRDVFVPKDSQELERLESTIPVKFIDTDEVARIR